jgi:hypothetical protein
MNVNLNTGAITLSAGGVLNAQAINLLNQSSAYETVLDIGSSGGVYVGVASQPLQLVGNGSQLTYNYPGAARVVWHSGYMGSGSGLDADLLDGRDSSYFLPASSYSAGDIMSKILSSDGSGSGLDADLLDGLDSSAFVRKSGDTMQGSLFFNAAGGELDLGWNMSGRTVYFYGQPAGAVGLYDNAVGVRFSTDVSGNFWARGDVTAFSDRSLKTDIVQITDAVDKVKQLVGATFTRTDINTRGTGLIAQDVEQVLPEAVHENEDGIKSVAYGNMVGLIVEALKEIDARLSALEAKQK